LELLQYAYVSVSEMRMYAFLCDFSKVSNSDMSFLERSLKRFGGERGVVSVAWSRAVAGSGVALNPIPTKLKT
jgi:hypothetical protein